MTLNESLNKEDFEILYKELLEDNNLEEKKTKNAKINQTIEMLIQNIVRVAVMFTDYDIKEIKKLMKNEKSEILDYLIANNVIFEIENQYIIPKKFKSIIEEAISEERYNEKIELVTQFYLAVNGVLSIDNLKGLLYGQILM